MLADTREGKVLINEVAYRLIQENAASELPRYVFLRDEYFSAPSKFSEPNVAQDEALGVGVTVALKLFTRAVFFLVPPILSFILNQVVEVLTEKGVEKAVEKAMNFVSSLFCEPKPQPLFTQEQLTTINLTIQQIADREAQQHHHHQAPLDLHPSNNLH